MKKAVIGVGVTVALLFGGCAYKTYGTIDQHEVRVNDMQRLADEKKWIVLTDKTTFENTDSIFHWKFNSSDLQGKIERDTMYSFTTVGWRVPFLSMYPNIIKIEKLENQQ